MAQAMQIPPPVPAGRGEICERDGGKEMAYPEALREHARRVEVALGAYMTDLDAPETLREAMAWSLLAGGKRLRPALLLATREIFVGGGGSVAPVDPMPAACAMELIHTYSLIHDDLPALDDDDLRRGRASNHKRFGEAMAILAGDALLTEAFALVTRAVGRPDARSEDAALASRIVQEIASAAGAGGMVGGQVLDLEATDRPLTERDLAHLHALKTGRLFRAAARCGAILGDADAADLEMLTRYADRLGLAFQVADDVLDVVASAEALGKTVGKDAEQHKNTYVSMLGVAGARALADRLRDEAVEAVSRFGAVAEPLRALAAFAVERSH